MFLMFQTFTTVFIILNYSDYNPWCGNSQSYKTLCDKLQTESNTYYILYSFIHTSIQLFIHQSCLYIHSFPSIHLPLESGNIIWYYLSVISTLLINYCKHSITPRVTLTISNVWNLAITIVTCFYFSDFYMYMYCTSINKHM